MDMRVVELLCSRICHDVIAPVSAINNGVELWEDMGPEGAKEAMDLIANAAGQAQRRLLFMRLSYGASGAEADPKTASEVAAGLFAGTRIDLDWANPSAARELPHGALKVLLNVILLASECIGAGGRISVNANGSSVTVSATGKTAQVREGMQEALAGRAAPSTMDARAAVASVTKHFVDHFNLALAVLPAPPDRVDFRISPR